MPESEPTVGEQLAVINTKLDVLIAQREDHEVRLRKLEQFKFVLVGACIAGGGVAGWLANAVTAAS